MKLLVCLTVLIAAAISMANPVQKRTEGSVSVEPASWGWTAIDITFGARLTPIRHRPGRDLYRPRGNRQLLRRLVRARRVPQRDQRVLGQRGDVRARGRQLLLPPLPHGVRRRVQVAHGLPAGPRHVRLAREVQPDGPGPRLGPSHHVVRVPRRRATLLTTFFLDEGSGAWLSLIWRWWCSGTVPGLLGLPYLTQG